MTIQKAGTEVAYTITYLEMTDRPAYGFPPLPASHPGSLLRAEAPPVWYYLALYDAVGRHYAWEDHTETSEALEAWLSDPKVELFSFIAHGWPQGFFVLDSRAGDTCDLSYFGLAPEAVGKGLGTFLLRTAVLTAWEREGVTRLTVNTNTLDHPRALQNYQKNGFTPVRREERTRVLKRDRDLTRIPD